MTQNPYKEHLDKANKVIEVLRALVLTGRYVGDTLPDDFTNCYVICRDGEVLKSVRVSTSKTGWMCKNKIFNLHDVVKWVYRYEDAR